MYDENYFLKAPARIVDNEEGLRQAQLDAYIEICNHFLVEESRSSAVAILPTGAGKTGVMALAPFGISKGRVLIITPQLVIKDHVMDSLDPSHSNNFWLMHNVFEDFNDLPNVVEYDKNTFQSELDESNIVVLNIHKLSSKSRNSLLNQVDEDYFDMIIIDEAHHSPAKTWQDSLDYFKNAKVLKVTGTPFRHDREPIEGDVVTNYRLGKAMNDGIVKTLKNFDLKPETVYLTIDEDESKTYTIEELEQYNIKSKNYIERSVAYSRECNQQIIDASLEQLNQRKAVSKLPHKIIAVCCSKKHANDVKEQYESSGATAVVIHSGLNKEEKYESLRKVESHQVDVVIHVAMLGEGYDHPYLSIAAIFRPFKSIAPYSQFIGRILRKIPDQNTYERLDNIGAVIAHRELGLQPLWKEYMKEQRLHDVLNSVKLKEKEQKEQDQELGNIKNTDISSVTTEGNFTMEGEYYEYTQAAQEYEKYEREIDEKAERLKEIFPDKDEIERRWLARKETEPVHANPLLKNPKKYRMILRSDFSQKVQYDIPAEIIADFELNSQDYDLSELPLKNRYPWVVVNATNDGIIAKYLNAVLNEKYGKRDKWRINDYENALSDLDGIVTHLRKMIEATVYNRRY